MAEVQEGSGVAPASVMLSAYGFYDGMERDKDGRTTKGGIFRMPCAVSDAWLGARLHDGRFAKCSHHVYTALFPLQPARMIQQSVR